MYKIADHEQTHNTIKFYGIKDVDVDEDASAAHIDYKLIGSIGVEEFKVPDELIVDGKIIKLDSQISKFFSLDDVVNNLLVVVFSSGTTKIYKLTHSLELSEIYSFKITNFDKSSKLGAYIEIYDVKKYKQERFVIGTLGCEVLIQTIITKTKSKLYHTEYQYYLYQQPVFGNTFDFKPKALYSGFNLTGSGTMLLLVLSSTLTEMPMTTGVCITPDPDEPSNLVHSFMYTSLPDSTKFLCFHDNVVIQHPDGIVIYNLSKQKELKIELKDED